MSFRKRAAFVRRPFRNQRVKQDSRSSQQPTTRSSSRQKHGKTVIEPLTPEELEEVEVWILRREQKKDFGDPRKRTTLWERVNDNKDICPKIIQYL